MYDHGLIGNFARYRQKTPPVYNLENIVTPVVLIYGKGDAIATPEVSSLNEILSTIFDCPYRVVFQESLDLLNRLRYARAESVPHDSFSHLDFIWAKDIKRLLQNRVVQIIENSRLNGSFSVL